MKSGKARLVLVMLLASVLVGSLATLSCGGGSKKSETPTPRPPAATNTPMVRPTGTPAALTPTGTAASPVATVTAAPIATAAHPSPTAAPTATAARPSPTAAPTATAAPPSPSPSPTPQAQQTSVTIKDFEFAPSKVTIKVGGTVTWTNNGPSTHTVTADDASFDSGQLQKGKTFSRTFDSAGTYSYHCSIHSSMTAQVVVEG